MCKRLSLRGSSRSVQSVSKRYGLHGILSWVTDVCGGSAPPQNVRRVYLVIVSAGVEDTVQCFGGARVCVDLGHDDGVDVVVGADVVQEVEVGVQRVAATLVQLLDVADGVTLRRAKQSPQAVTGAHA
jgi:hypothetical protein